MRIAFWNRRGAQDDVAALRRAGLAAVRRRWLALALALAIVLALAWLLSPLLLWAYDVERAGSLIDRGMTWPEPRGFSSLPTARDPAALEQALAYLDDAVRRRPDHSHAYRLIGQVRAALGQLKRAADAFELAAARSPDDPMPRWEASLVYERIRRIVEQAPRTPLLDAFAEGDLVAPGQLVKSQFCNENGAASCYLGRTEYSMPYAAFPNEPAVKLPVLFLHPPASISQSVAIPDRQTALHFVFGLDPVARDWRTDGATFRVWVTPAGGARELAREIKIGRIGARRGWLIGWADLARWVGQTITITLETDPGAAGDTTDDWFGRADVALT
jgi:hypothetical protein